MELGALATRRLQEIRRSYGIQKEPFKLPKFETVMPGSEIQELFHSSRLLVKNGRVVFAYIRDHRTRRDLHKTGLDPRRMYKVHMAACEALKEMKAKMRLQRYVITESTDDKREIDIGGDDVVKVRLHPCQYCLGETCYRGFNRDTMTYRERMTIVNEFRAKDVMPHLNTIMKIFSN